MEYVGDASRYIYGSPCASFKYMSTQFEFKGNLYFAGEFVDLFKVTDFSKQSGFTIIRTPGLGEKIVDVVVEGDTAYVLSSVYDYKEKDKPARIALYKTKDMRKFETITTFRCEVCPLSLVKDGNFLYLSMGNKNLTNVKNGTMLRIKLPDAQ